MREVLRLRPVTLADARALFDWVNEADVRAQSFSSKPVSWPEHLDWLSRKLADVACRFWIAETGGAEAIGQIRFEPDDASAKLSFSVAKEFRGQGYGPQLVAAGCRQFFLESRLEQIFGYVKPQNVASQRTLARAGLTMSGTTTQAGQPAQVWIRSKRSCA